MEWENSLSLSSLLAVFDRFEGTIRRWKYAYGMEIGALYKECMYCHI